MARLNVSSETSLMVGNSFETDILGACKAGIQSMIINSKLTEEQKNIIKDNKYQVTELSSLIDLMDIL
jgi:putative hydrolase of the HAD superfamily